MFPLRDDQPSGRFPILVLGLIVLQVAIFLYELFLDPEATALLFARAGVVPSFFHQSAPEELQALPSLLTLISSTFLHSGWLHLLGNIWFLWIFGDNLEAKLGSLVFLPVYFICGAASAGAQILTDGAALEPIIGASGAVAGLLGIYLVLFPTAQIETLIMLLVYVRMIRVPALLYLLLWLVLQVTGLLRPSSVAWWSLLVAFGLGVGIGIVVRSWHRGKEEILIGGPRGRRRGIWEQRSLSGRGLTVRLPPEHR
jgi:membrane associated rhomboid family serine protease